MARPEGTGRRNANARGRPVLNSRKVSDELLQAMEYGLRSKSHLDLTTREIATTAGTNPGMIHYYYQSKSGLLDAALDNLTTDVTRTLEDLNQLFLTDCHDATRKIVTAWLDLIDTHQGTVSVVLLESFRPYSTLWCSYRKKKSRGSFGRIQQVVRTLMDRGYYRPDIDPELAALSIASIIHSPMIIGHIISEIGHPVDHILDAWPEEAIKLIDARYRLV